MDLGGAALLAYDVLYGPRARFEASIRRAQLDRATLGGARTEKDEAELYYWEKHEHRAQRMALWGLILLMAGFVCQGVGTLLTAIR